MSGPAQVFEPAFRVPRIAVAALAAVFLAGLFAVGFDQGHALSLVQGSP